MLVNQLLLPIGVDNNCEVVKGLNGSPHLKSIDEVYRDRYRILAQLIQKRILDINRLVHFSRTPNNHLDCFEVYSRSVRNFPAMISCIWAA